MGKFTVLNDIPYGEHDRHKLDIFLPQEPITAKGVILFIHGGGWHMGDKSDHHPDTEYFCEKGYVTATMNYRFVSENISVFNELDDITLALKTIKRQCVRYGHNVEKVVLSGGSAGGHLSLLYAYTRKDEAAVTPVAVCVYCPPTKCWTPDFLMGVSGEFENWKYDILSKCSGAKLSQENFLDEPQQIALKKISPQQYVSKECVPTAVFHGRKDTLVPFKSAVDFLEALTEHGVKNELLIFENSDHSLDKDPEMWEKAREVTEKYSQLFLQ